MKTSTEMKHFLFLIKTRKDRLASLSPEQMQQHVVNVRQFIESLISNGQIKVARAVEMTGFALSGLNEGSLQAAKETLGPGSLAIRADVSNLADLDTMFATIKREFGHLDGLFVNAGHSDFRLFEEVTEQSFDKVIAVDFKGVYFTIQKALPLLRQGSSVIIN